MELPYSHKILTRACIRIEGRLESLHLCKRTCLNLGHITVYIILKSRKDKPVGICRKVGNRNFTYPSTLIASSCCSRLEVILKCVLVHAVAVFVTIVADLYGTGVNILYRLLAIRSDLIEECSERRVLAGRCRH